VIGQIVKKYLKRKVIIYFLVLDTMCIVDFADIYNV